jgi:hypothetical protein
MTDAAFNEYLRATIRREFPAALDTDPRAELADGRIIVRSVTIEQSNAGWVMDVQPCRCMRQILRAWQLCSEELERRSFA